MQDTTKRVIDKFLSGRFLLTVATAAVFLKSSWSVGLDVKDVAYLIIIVFTLYFNKQDRNKGETK